ncbi:MAG TPA: FimV/HubP family polar landmark protein [Steroidobacteraceae bacterium]
MVAKSLSRALALILFFPPAALALGLGDIRLLSPLNAPLDAEIELVGATPEELNSLKAQIASRETFARYGLDWPAYLNNVTVRTQRSADGRDIIKLRSTESITEPFITLLVEVNWARGRLVREYTVLLDPPVYTPGQQEQLNAGVVAPVVGTGERDGTISRETPARQAQTTQPAPSASFGAPASAVGGTERIVRRGDTLSAIAAEYGGDSRAWMLAIFQANPHAFDGNMNLLRSGAVLRIPDSATVAAISPIEAAAEIRRQHAAWRASSPASARISEQGRLRLVTPSDSSGAGGSSSEETAALQNRVRELEAQLRESQRLLEARNAELARLQARLAEQAGEAPAQEAPAPAEPEPAAEAPADEALASAEETEAGLSETETEEAVEAAEEAAPVEAEEPAPAPVTRRERPTSAATTEEAEGSFFDTLKSFWWVLAALVAVVLALFGLKAWRSRQQSEFDDSLGRLAAAGSSTFGRETGGDTAPLRPGGREPAFVVEESGTHERPRFAEDAVAAVGAAAARTVSVPADETISSETAINLDQGDPLAEADFHMAYGLYDQAADLVRIAIQREPERRDLRLKLLEVYFVWGNKEQFLQCAREFAETRDQAAPGEWEKIVIMGKQLAPEDPLFAGGSGSGAAAGGVDLNLEGGQSRVDFDVFGESGSEGASAGDIDLDIGSALGERNDSTVEQTAARATDTNLALHDVGYDLDNSTATTREMTQSVSEPPDLGLPDLAGDTMEQPTLENPALYAQGNPTIRQKVEMAMKQSGASPEQTAELAIDDLGLDLTAMDTMDQAGLGASPDAPTLVAGLDEHSRRIMEEAERRSARTGDETVVSPTGSWKLSSEDLEPTMPPSTVHALGNGHDTSATSRLGALQADGLDFNFDQVDGGASGANGHDVDLDVGTATVPDAAFTETQKLSSDDLALPDLEPVTMSEVGTKLDLARAYMDMGDPEGARNILEEVLTEGSVAQKQEAQRLLDSLPG